MARTAQMWTRRAALVALAAGAAGLADPALATRRKVVTLLGDSITAGYGLPAGEALPARLQQALARIGVAALVRGAGVSGDTTAAGLARLAFSVALDTDVAVVELGGNDLLQGLEPPVTKANLTRIVQRLRARRIAVVLTGISAPAVIGAAYAREFDAVFGEVARAQGVALYPDLLAGVARHPALIQGDGIHPSAAGVAVIAERLAPLVARALRDRP